MFGFTTLPIFGAHDFRSCVNQRFELCPADFMLLS